MAIIETYRRRLELAKTVLLPPSWSRIRTLAQIRYYSKQFLEHVPYFPFDLDIEPTTRCNLACPMCQLRTWTKPRRDLSLEEFKKIVNQFPGLARIKLQGMGEPLLNESFFDMVKWASGKNIRVRTITNGTLMDNRIAQNFISSGLAEVTISLDSTNPDTYSEIRKGADYHQVVDNIRTLVRARGNRRYPAIRLAMLGMHSNMGELSDMVKLADELSVEELIFQPNLNYYAKIPMEETLKNERLMHEEILSTVSEGLKHAERLGVNLLVSVYDSPCRWPWTSCYISVEGLVVPCCHLADPDVINFGNIFEVPFSQIWNSPDYKKFRRALEKGPVPECCEGCYSVSPHTPSLRAFLQEMKCGLD